MTSGRRLRNCSEVSAVPFQFFKMGDLRVSVVNNRSCIIKRCGLRNRTTESQSARRTNDGDDYFERIRIHRIQEIQKICSRINLRSPLSLEMFIIRPYRTAKL